MFYIVMISNNKKFDHYFQIIKRRFWSISDVTILMLSVYSQKLKIPMSIDFAKKLFLKKRTFDTSAPSMRTFLGMGMVCDTETPLNYSALKQNLFTETD